MPPAKESMSGCAVSFRSSRISEPFSRFILLANCTMYFSSSNFVEAQMRLNVQPY